MLARRLLKIASFVFALSVGLASVSLARANRRADKPKTTILWVQEVDGEALYWVNDKPCGRAPLSGIVAATGRGRNIALTVILDSRVPIQEMADIEDLMAKVAPESVYYYVFNRSYPRLGMSKIVWGSHSTPLPAVPPKAK